MHEGPREHSPRKKVVPLETIAAHQEKELTITDAQLKEIAPSLRDLAHRIQAERPDALVFLDLSARIFGTPYHKYLTETMGSEAPEIIFYNDSWLKSKYLDNDSESIADIAQEDFAPHKGKKVFFIDETYSRGKGAVPLLSTAAAEGVDAYYIALTTDPAPLNEPEELRHANPYEHAQSIKKFREEGRLVTYPVPIKNLFSQLASRKYVQDHNGVTVPMSVEKPREEGESAPEPELPEGVSKEEYLQDATALFDTHVRTVKQKIYDILKESEAV